MTHAYAVVIERAADNYAAYVPDLPGVVATGESVEQTMQEIGEAISLYLEEATQTGEAVPPPSTHVTYIGVSTAA